MRADFLSNFTSIADHIDHIATVGLFEASPDHVASGVFVKMNRFLYEGCSLPMVCKVRFRPTAMCRTQVLLSPFCVYSVPTWLAMGRFRRHPYHSSVVGQVRGVQSVWASRMAQAVPSNALGFFNSMLWEANKPIWFVAVSDHQ